MHVRGDIAIAPSVRYLERAYDEAKYGAFSKRPLNAAESFVGGKSKQLLAVVTLLIEFGQRILHQRQSARVTGGILQNDLIQHAARRFTALEPQSRNLRRFGDQPLK